VALLFIPVQFAHASVDDAFCTPHWNLREAESYCNNWGYLNPGNDSRVNLEMLLADRGAASLPTAISSEDRSPDDAKLQRQPFGQSDFLRALEPVSDDEIANRRHALDQAVDRLKPTSIAISYGQSFAKGEASRCLSNDAMSASQFINQIASAPLAIADRKILAEARLSILQQCDFSAAEIAGFAALPGTSSEFHAFARYLQGAAAFYAGDFDIARDAFQALAEADQPWLKETALYMTARTALNKAQVKLVQQYGLIDLDQVDKDAANEADADFDRYLKSYPKGLYAASAQGLKRKAAWLLQDRPRLAKEYGEALATQASFLVVEEADIKFLTGCNGLPSASSAALSNITDPDLLAVCDLMAMRFPKNRGHLTAEILETQREAFKERPDLYRYLQGAQAFYIAADPAKALALLASSMPVSQLSYLAFSEQVLRGLALDAKGDLSEAHKLWTNLLPKAQRPLQRAVAEMALAHSYELTGQVDALFAPGAPPLSTDLHGILLSTVAGPSLLRQVAHSGAAVEDRTAALRTLLYKDLTRGWYRDFVTDLALLPPGTPEPPGQSDAPDAFKLNVEPGVLSLFRWSGRNGTSAYKCPSLQDIAELLARDSQSPKGLNCLGEFILRNHLDQFDDTGLGSWSQHSQDDLGSAPSQFQGPLFSRLDGYMRVMANPAAEREDKAYALFRAINCFARVGANTCGPQSIEQSQRGAWFHRLKTEFKDTKWAHDQDIYW